LCLSNDTAWQFLLLYHHLKSRSHNRRFGALTQINAAVQAGIPQTTS
jgi:hypothetical protein